MLMASESRPSTEEIRQMANSYDGVPTDVFDRWFAQVKADLVTEGMVAERVRAHKILTDMADLLTPMSGMPEGMSPTAWATQQMRAEHFRLAATLIADEEKF